MITIKLKLCLPCHGFAAGSSKRLFRLFYDPILETVLETLIKSFISASSLKTMKIMGIYACIMIVLIMNSQICLIAYADQNVLKKWCLISIKNKIFKKILITLRNLKKEFQHI